MTKMFSSPSNCIPYKTRAQLLSQFKTEMRHKITDRQTTCFIASKIETVVVWEVPPHNFFGEQKTEILQNLLNWCIEKGKFLISDKC